MFVCFKKIDVHQLVEIRLDNWLINLPNQYMYTEHVQIQKLNIVLETKQKAKNTELNYISFHHVTCVNNDVICCRAVLVGM